MYICRVAQFNYLAIWFKVGWPFYIPTELQKQFYFTRRQIILKLQHRKKKISLIQATRYSEVWARWKRNKYQTVEFDGPITPGQLHREAIRVSWASVITRYNSESKRLRSTLPSEYCRAIRVWKPIKKTIKLKPAILIITTCQSCNAIDLV